jgi:hypothetical protein
MYRPGVIIKVECKAPYIRGHIVQGLFFRGKKIPEKPIGTKHTGTNRHITGKPTTGVIVRGKLIADADDTAMKNLQLFMPTDKDVLSQRSLQFLSKFFSFRVRLEYV